MQVEASYQTNIGNGNVQCLLCPNNCIIEKEKSGKCLIRNNNNGLLIQSSFCEFSSVNVDHIEKKPLFNYKPGSNILSVGTNGCNMNCPYCQNAEISFKLTNRKSYSIEELLEFAKRTNSIGIAYTYNEPSIWFEFVLECSKVFRENGLKNVLVTNGYINEAPLRELLPFIDAANVDIKTFNKEKYNKLGGNLDIVLNNIKIMMASSVHLEITNLIVPNKSDNKSEFVAMCKWIASVNVEIPLHISRYFPRTGCKELPTEPALLNELYHEAKSFLSNVYLGNIYVENMNNTICSYCSNLIVWRKHHKINVYNNSSQCQKCGKKLYFTP